MPLEGRGKRNGGESSTGQFRYPETLATRESNFNFEWFYGKNFEDRIKTITTSSGECSLIKRDGFTHENDKRVMEKRTERICIFLPRLPGRRLPSSEYSTGDTKS